MVLPLYWPSQSLRVSSVVPEIIVSGLWHRTHGQRKSDALESLYSGLELFVLALTHFINHAFGLISIEAKMAVQELL